MKKALSRILVFTIILLLASCDKSNVIYYGKYSGTIPYMEIESVNIQSEVIFLNLLENSIEYKNFPYKYEITEDDGDKIGITCNIQINDDLSCSRLIYDKQKGILNMELAQTDRMVQLEKYDEMIKRKVDEFVPVKLKTDISHLSENQKIMLSKLFQAAAIMDNIFWIEACPTKDQIVPNLQTDEERLFFNINYGPWERLNGHLPFLEGIGKKPAGSGFYPADMTKKEFEAFEDDSKTSLYTIIKRNPDGGLASVPYHIAFKDQVQEASKLINEAAELAEDPGFKKYLTLRAKALLTDDYYDSDMAWMDMKDNDIDFVVGPIENYEDMLYNYKAAHEAFILIKDKEWSKKLAFISSLLPELQKSLPVSAEYKAEVPGSDSDLGAYDVVYYAGDCNASSKTIAINLPNDERVQLAKGSRKLQLKNAIQYKFENILVPISNILIAEDQREYIKFDAFFENTMFHEVAHGLGLNNTINGKGTVRNALMDQYSALEEGKADILGLFLVTKLAEAGELEDKELMDNYVTFMASIFRSVRFGVASSHGKANMIRFYYFQENGAFTRDEESGTYRIDFKKMQSAMNKLGREILTIQGDGNYEAAKELVEEKGFIKQDLQNDLDRLQALNIPVDIRFEQGPLVLGL